MVSNTERFTNRVENYVKYRPDYPSEVTALFRDEMGLNKDSTVADIGSGTGISTRMLLEQGCIVFGVEPNDAMRAAAEEYLAGYDNFRSVKGTAENTGLEKESVDLVTAAQAFHWFDIEAARLEWERILKPGGWTCLIWNERQLDSTPFLREYEQFLIKFAGDYTKVRHENTGKKTLKSFFRKDFRHVVFPNRQVLDFDGLLGRVLSSSYMPADTDESFPQMKNELLALVAKHAENGNIEITYDTTVLYSQI